MSEVDEKRIEGLEPPAYSISAIVLANLNYYILHYRSCKMSECEKNKNC